MSASWGVSDLSFQCSQFIALAVGHKVSNISLVASFSLS